MFTRIQIDKSGNSNITGEAHTIYVPKEEVKDYVNLLKKTWPSTKLSKRNIA